MTERKVLNKYYPPDFDPSKLPRLRLSKNRQFNVRIMAPCNMKCKTCGEYIYKGKKFNSRQETVEGETHLGLRIFRFYIKCPRCMAEITFKTDLEEMDYILEEGATRNFQAVRLAEQQEEKAEEARVEEEKSNPMIALERRTQDSRHEMDRLEALEELRDLNMRQANVNHEEVIRMTVEKEMQMQREEEEAEEAFISSIFGKDKEMVIKRIHDDDEDLEEEGTFMRLRPSTSSTAPTELLAPTNPIKKPKTEKDLAPWEKSVGSFGGRSSGLSGLVVKSKPHINKPSPSSSASGSGTSKPVVSVLTSGNATVPSTKSTGGLGLLVNQYGSSDED